MMRTEEQGVRRVSRLASGIAPFLVMEVFERAAALESSGRRIVHLEVGEPDFETPEVVREAGIRAIRDGHTHYTHSLGRPELREAIAQWQRRQYGIDIDPGRIVVSLGSSGAMVLTFGAILDPGDEVLIGDPGYACYPKFVRAFGGVPVFLPVEERSAFEFDLEAVTVALTPRTKAILLNSPANPTGRVTSARKMRGLCQAVRDRALVVSDEIYHGLVYEDRAHSILEFTSDAVVVNGFSKLFAMTGWRLGYTILPAELVRPVQKLQQNLFISAPDFAQIAAVAALTQAGADVERMRQKYDERRKFVLGRLASFGLEPAVQPTGAFYVFLNVARYTADVYSFVFQLLEEAGVAVTPGVDFGPNGEGYIRICYANSMENLEEGISRLEEFLSRRNG